MTEPIAQFTEDKHAFTWPSMGIGVTLHSFFEDRERNLHAMMAIHDLPQNGEEMQFFTRGRQNITSPTSIERLASGLSKKCTEINLPAWQAMLTQVCVSAQVYREKGQPVLNVMEAPRREKAALLDPLLPYGQVTMIFADGESGKSLIAAALLLAMHLGLDLPYPLSYANRTPGLYLDWESDASDHRDRIEWLTRGWGIDPLSLPPIYYLGMSRRLVDDLPRIRKSIEETRAGFIVVDSIAAACGATDLKDAEAPVSTLTALRLLSPVTSLVLAHTNKENAAKESGRGQAYGNIFFRNYVRRSWELRSYKNLEYGWLRVGLFLDKANWRPGAIGELGLEFEFDTKAEAVSFKRLDLSKDLILSAFGRAVLRLEAVLDEPKTIKQLSDELGLRQPVIKARLNEHPEKFVNVTPGGGGRGKEAHWAKRSWATDP